MTKEKLLAPIEGYAGHSNKVAVVFDVEKFLVKLREEVRTKMVQVNEAQPWCIRCHEKATLTVALLQVQQTPDGLNFVLSDTTGHSKNYSGMQFDVSGWSIFVGQNGRGLCPECAQQVTKEGGPENPPKGNEVPF